MDDVLNDALSNLVYDNYEHGHKGYENRQADVALIRAALAAQPAASAEPSDEEAVKAHMALVSDYGSAKNLQGGYEESGDHDYFVRTTEAAGVRYCAIESSARALLSRYGRPAGDAQPVAVVDRGYQGQLRWTASGALRAASLPDGTELYAAPVAAHKPDGGDAKDAQRWRWITDDHNDPRVRVELRALFDRLPVMSYSAACAAVDAAMAQQRQERQS